MGSEWSKQEGLSDGEYGQVEEKCKQGGCLHAVDAEALREQVEQLSTALGAEVAEAKAAATKAKAAATKSESEKKALQTELDALREELSDEQKEGQLRVSALKKELDEQKKLFGTKEHAHAQQISALEEAVRSYERASAQSQEERGKRFHYVLACNGQEGSILRSVLMSDPDSILLKMYNGEWDYEKDACGRAVVMCHPKRWAAVLEHLATGAVSAERDPQLLAQARFWKLQRLVEGLEALTPGVVITNYPDQKGFKIRCTFVSVMEKMSGAGEMSLTFATCGNYWWSINVNQSGTTLRSKTVPKFANFESPPELKEIKVSSRWHLLLREGRITRGNWKEIVYPSTEEMSYGCSWGNWVASIHDLVSEPLARAPGSLVLEVEVRYAASL